MQVLLPDGNPLELEDGATGLDAARAIGQRLARDTIAVEVDGELHDLRLPLPEGARFRVLTARDPEALAVLRHSTAHVLAEAVTHLWPGVRVAIGPAIDDGFYYDFEFPEPVSADDLGRIEEEMRRILAAEHPFVRTDGVDKAQLAEQFRGEDQPYKLELVEALADGDISVYDQDGFEDLCRGPHLQTTKPIKAFKLLSMAGAYWRGDSSKPMLTRIYGTVFFDQQSLDDHLERLEQARRRDHRRIGRELHLYHSSEVSPGGPFWHPRGMIVWNELTALWRELNRERGYQEVRTPILYSADLWKQSGHWDKFRDDMFFTQKDDRLLGLKPMNCPAACPDLRGRAAVVSRSAAAARRAGHRAPGRAVRGAARPDAGDPHHPGRRAHLLHPRAGAGRGDRLPRARPDDLRHLRPRPADRALDPAREPDRRRRAVGRRRGGAARAHWRRSASSTR